MFVLALSIYLMQHFQIILPQFINHYVNDFLYLPIALFLIQSLIRLNKVHHNFEFSFSTILLLVVYNSLLFEWIFPKFHSRYTADFLDVLFYFLGGLTFYVIEKVDKLKTKKNPSNL